MDKLCLLEQLKAEGWSYFIGYNQGFQSYHVRIWKSRPRPERVKTSSGQWIILYLWCYGGLGTTYDKAIEECMANKLADRPDNTDPEYAKIRSN